MTSKEDLEVIPTNGLAIVMRAIAPTTKNPGVAAPDWRAVTRVKIMGVNHRGWTDK
jgi:hypothetical protein